MNTVEVFVFVKLSKQCKIETCVLSNINENYSETWKELTSDGWVLSTCQAFKI